MKLIGEKLKPLTYWQESEVFDFAIGSPHFRCLGDMSTFDFLKACGLTTLDALIKYFDEPKKPKRRRPKQ